jgi:hypothetical protein
MLPSYVLSIAHSFLCCFSCHRPLFEQLEEQKEKKDAEYDAVTKMMFAPTKALDEEEAQHMNDVEDAKRTARELVRMQESRDLDSFNLARQNRTVRVVEENPSACGGCDGGATGATVSIAMPRTTATKSTVLNVKLKKRKLVTSEEKSHKNANVSAAEIISKSMEEAPVTRSTNHDSTSKKSVPLLFEGLEGYGSDESN